MALDTYKGCRFLAQRFAIVKSTQLVVTRSLFWPPHPGASSWSAPAQIDVEFNPRTVKFAGKVTFAGRVRSFKDSIKLVAELFVKVSWGGPCHQVLKLVILITRTACPKNSRLRSMLGLRGESSGSIRNALAISRTMTVPVDGSIFPGLNRGYSRWEFHTTTLRKVVSCAGASLSANATSSRHTLLQLTEWILVECVRG